MDNKIYDLIKEAEELRESSQYKESLKLFKKAVSLSRKQNDLQGLIDSTVASADIYRMIGEFDNAVESYEEALEACEALGDAMTAADCLAGMGLSLRAMGMWKEAIRFIKTSQKTYIKEEDKKGLAFSLWAEAGAWRVAGNITKTIEVFNQALEVFTALREKPGKGYAICGLGGAHRMAGKFKESLKYYKQANTIFSGLKDTFGTAYSHCGIGNAYRMLGDFEKAQAHFSDATRLYAEIGDIVSYSYTLWSLATLHKVHGDLDLAQEYTDKAMKNFLKTKDPRGIIYCNLTLGEVDFMRGKKKQGIKKVRSALESAEGYGFKLERCHCRTLLGLMEGTRKPACYKGLGVSIDLTAIPLNIP
ncbi:MAG: tetratricopeptide repeat protein [Nitrospirales bacterium]|nr:tetratricopeptide repeat protein [Nitrospirales bacterium]